MPPPRRHLVAASVLFAASLGVVYHTLRGLTGPTELFTRVLLSPDELFPECLYRDLFVDGYSFRTFRFSAATFAAPDLGLYAAVRVAAGSAPRAVLPWAALFFLLLVATAAVAARAAVPADRRINAAAGVLLLAAAYLGVSCVAGFEHRELGEFYLPLYHGGAVIATFVGLALVAGVVRRPTPWRPSWRVLALVAVAAGATFSDRLFAVWFPVPMAVAAVTVGLLRPGGWRAWPGFVEASAATAVGCGLGVLAVGWVFGPNDALSEYWNGFDPTETLRLLGVLAAKVGREAVGGNVVLVAALGWLALCAGKLGAAVFCSLPAWGGGLGWRVELAGSGGRPSSREGLPPKGGGSIAGDDGFRFLAAFSLAGAATNAIVVCLSQFGARDLEAFPWEECSRYFLAPQAVGWFGWAAWLARSPRPAAAYGPVVAVAGLLLVAACRIGPPVRDVFDFYPPDVQALDEACRARGLTSGLGDYGTAKRVTVLSRGGVTVRQVWPGPEDPRPLHAAHWLSNAEWYWKPPRGAAGPVHYQFVVTHPDPDHPWLIDPDRVVAAFGEPAERVPVGDAVLLVYDRPTDAAVRDFAETNPGVLGMRERYGAGGD